MSQARRRQVLLAAAAFLAVPAATIAQQRAGQVRRVGVLSGLAKTDPEIQSRFLVFEKRLQELGWKEGSNLRIDYRFAEGDTTLVPNLAKELLDLLPDVVVALGTSAATAFRQRTLSTPIVFTNVPDPVAAGLVTNLARPDGNITGFTSFEFSIVGKWLQLIKECAPKVSRVLVVFDPSNPSWTAYMRAIEASVHKFDFQLTPAGAHSATELEQEMETFTKLRDGALIVLPSPVTVTHRERIISLAARHRLPAIYPYSYYVVSGGLMSYGADLPELIRSAGSYVDRILRGAKPADLPIQQPTKYELTINMKTAKALGIAIPKELQLRADRVIK